MAQDIIYNKKTYKSVPAVELPTTAGGKASFIDTSDGTATAGDIATDKIAYVNGEKIVGTHALLSKMEVEKIVDLDLSNGNQTVLPQEFPNLWTTDQTYPLSNGILYDSDTEVYTIPTTAKALIAEIYTLPVPIPAGTVVSLTIQFYGGQTAKSGIVIGGYHKGNDGNSWQGYNEKMVINTDLTNKKETYSTKTTKTVTHFVIFIDSSVVGNISKEIKFKVEYTAKTQFGYTLSSVIIKKPDTLLPENIKKDINIAGITGALVNNGSGGGEISSGAMNYVDGVLPYEAIEQDDAGIIIDLSTILIPNYNNYALAISFSNAEDSTFLEFVGFIIADTPITTFIDYQLGYCAYYVRETTSMNTYQDWDSYEPIVCFLKENILLLKGIELDVDALANTDSIINCSLNYN